MQFSPNMQILFLSLLPVAADVPGCCAEKPAVEFHFSHHSVAGM